MTNIKILPLARREMADIFNYYRHIRHQLGVDFVVRMSECLDRIMQFPEMYAIVRKHIRLGQLRQFPFVVAYWYDDKDLVTVEAISHTSRNLATLWRQLPKQ